MTARSIVTVDLSVVIPVYNEAAVLIPLFDRLYPVLDGLVSATKLCSSMTAAVTVPLHCCVSSTDCART